MKWAGAGVNESTVCRLMQRDDFQKAYRAAQDKALDGDLGTLQGRLQRRSRAFNETCRAGCPRRR